MTGRSGIAITLSCALLATLMSGAPGAAGEEGPAPPQEQGPFEERNQFPFNLLFLAFPARGGRTLSRGEQQILFSQTYANTFVGSDIFFDDFEPYIQFPDSRRTLTSELVIFAQSLKPGQSLFFADTEQGRTEIRWRAGITNRFEAGLEIPFLSYFGGISDGLIEGYHRMLGLSGGGRDLFVRNLSEFALTLEGDSYFTSEAPASYQLGDLSLFGRYQIIRSASRDVALSAGVKLPTGDPERLGGSGSADGGVELEGTERWGRHRLHYGAGWVRTGGWSLFPRFRPADTASLFAAYEFAPRRTFSWIAQLQSQTSVFRGMEGKDPDLSQPSNEFLGGVKWSTGDSRWSFEAAFIENLFDQNNGVDIGIRAGAALRIPPR